MRRWVSVCGWLCQIRAKVDHGLVRRGVRVTARGRQEQHTNRARRQSRAAITPITVQAAVLRERTLGAQVQPHRAISGRQLAREHE